MLKKGMQVMPFISTGNARNDQCSGACRAELRFMLICAPKRQRERTPGAA